MVGLINVQYAIKNGTVYVLEVNPRASRTIPFVSKAIGVPLALAARVMLGETLAEVGLTEEIVPTYVSVKEAVFPFNKFVRTDPVLGPEMRSTGEVMGIADSFGWSFAKAQLAASNGLPLEGCVLITVNDHDKATVTPIARRFQELGFRVLATTGTAKYLRARGIPVTSVFKVHEGRPNCLDFIVNGDVHLLINTPLGKHSQVDDYTLREGRAAEQDRLHDHDVRCERGGGRDSRLAVAQAEREVLAGVAARAWSADVSAPAVFVHESSYVDEGAQIGKGSKIWHFCHVMPDVVIGSAAASGRTWS